MSERSRTSLFDLFLQCDLALLQSDSPPAQYGDDKVFGRNGRSQSAPSSSSRKTVTTKRNSSLPRFRRRSRLNEDQELNCVTCKNRYGIYIYQCRNGHSSCKECKISDASCGVCGEPVSHIRNITLESYVSERTVRCTNAREGCLVYKKVYQMEAHIPECPFKEIVCPAPNCSWQSKFSKIARHFDAEHPEHRLAAIETELIIPDITVNSTSMNLVQKGPYNFLMHVKVDETGIYMAFQLIGTHIAALKWTYEVEFYNESQLRLLQYKDICHPHSTPIEDILKEMRCMAIPMCLARNLADNGRLKYEVFLYKDFVHNTKDLQLDDK